MSSIKPYPKPFKFSNGEGTVELEVPVELSSDKDKDFYKFAQLLKWKDDGYSIRIGYYFKPLGASENKWKWGRNAPTINIESVDKLIETLTTLKEKEKEKQLQK